MILGNGGGFRVKVWILFLALIFLPNIYRILVDQNRDGNVFGGDFVNQTFVTVEFEVLCKGTMPIVERDILVKKSKKVCNRFISRRIDRKYPQTPFLLHYPHSATSWVGYLQQYLHIISPYFYFVRYNIDLLHI